MERHARRRDIPYTEVEDGLVLYDAERRAAHSLSPVAGAVWRACDGRSSVREIAAALGLERAVVDTALAELRAGHLLEDGTVARAGSEVSRRQALKRLGAVALAPAVISIALPAAASAQSGGCQSDGSPCLDNTDCCGGFCIGVGSPATGGEGVCRDGGCGTNADPCTSNTECCAGNPFCDSGQCAPCVSDGNPCGSDAQCCLSHFCSQSVCADCRSTPDPCSSDTECCTGICDASVCADCRGGGASCSINDECCSQDCQGGVCQ